jgi:RHS repeat-associated protein
MRSGVCSRSPASSEEDNNMTNQTTKTTQAMTTTNTTLALAPRLRRAASRACMAVLGITVLFASTAWAQTTASSTTLASSINPTNVGAATTLTATVTPSDATGTITFKDGNTVLSRVALNAGAAVLLRSFSTAATHNLTAAYGGSTVYGTSTSAVLPQLVTTAPTSVSLNSSFNPVPVGQSTVLWASVSPGSATGVITFREGTNLLGTATLASGVASLTKSFATAGAYSLTAAYAGSAQYQSATSAALAQSVGDTPVAIPPPPASPMPLVNYEYDAQGNLTKTIRGLGVPGFGLDTRTAYDTLERATTITDARSGVTQLGYDGLDRNVSVTDPRSLLTQTPRNGLGDATKLSSPDTGTTTFTYDTAGNLKTQLDSRGVLATHTYDALDRRTKIAYTQAGQTTQNLVWTYDQVGAGYSNGIGRLTSTSHPGGSTQYTYDPQGRLLTAIQKVTAATGANTAQISKTVGYGYDAAGNITRITYPSGRVLTIAYSGGKPTTLALAKDASSTATELLSQIQFSPFGAATSWQWQYATGPQAATRIYDTAGRLVRYQLGRFVRDVSYDAGDRITGTTHYDLTTGTASAAATALDQSFAYDELDRLTGVTTAAASWAIGYDANGNRTGVTLNGNSSSYTTAATSNRLDSISNPARSLAYDNAGNTTSDTGNAYASTYDLTGRLVTLTKAGVTTTYSYNAQGQRVRKFSSTNPNSTVIFAYDQNGQLLGEYNSAGAAMREYVWLGTTPVAMFTPDVGTNPPLVYFIHADHIDTPRVVLDRNNAVRWRWMAEPFGTTAPETDPQGLGSFTQNLRFPGQYADSESGLNYNWNRDYDASIGRYVQSDPIGLRGGVNTYSYVEGNPVGLIDPAGLWAWGDPVDQDIVNAVTGFGDAFLVSELIRDAFDVDGGVNQCSMFYRGGKVAGFVAGSVPFALRGAAALGGTRFAHALNHNRYLRFGPGRIPANGSGLPFGTGVPRMSIGPQVKGGPPNPHVDLRSRVPYVPPAGGPAECGCP